MASSRLSSSLYPLSVRTGSWYCNSRAFAQIVERKIPSLPTPSTEPVRFRNLALSLALLTSLAAPRLLATADSVVVFNEVHYHPADEANDTEWIELHNLHGVDVDISGWQLRGGANFDFVEGTVVPGHGYLIIAANPNHSSLSGVNALGPFTGKLANNGEALRLENRNDRVMDRLSYGDDADWPSGPDGSGATLVKLNQNSSDARPSNWTTSPELGGSPGETNFPVSGQLPTQHDLIDLDALWKYRDTNSAPPANWKDPSFNDAGWASGPGALYAGTFNNPGSATPLSIPNGLVGYWNFDGNVTDQSGAGNHGSLQGASYTNDSPLAGGQALDFNANTEHVLVSSGASLNSTIFTVSFYMKDRGQGGNVNRLMSRQSDRFELGIDKVFGSNGLAYNSPAHGWNTTTSVPPLNTWQHVAYVVTNSTITIYVDGAVVHGPINFSAAPSGFFHIGNRHNNVEGFNGLMDEVAMWNRALSATEVASLSGGSSLPPLTTQLAHGSPTHYFRHQFQYNGAPSRTSLALHPIFDDGAVVYLNGLEVYRENLPGGAVTHSTLASSEVTDPAFTNPPVNLPVGSLLNGTNVLAVEVHQNHAASPDMLFGATLDAIEQASPPFEFTPGLAFNELSASGTTPFMIELRNAGESSVNLGDFQIGHSSGTSYSLPNQLLNPGELFTVDEPTLGFTPTNGDRLFLYGSAASAVVDAREVTNRLRGLSKGEWLYPDAPSFGTANSFSFEDDIVINEIMFNAPGLSAVPGSPATYQTVTLSPYNATWRYNESGDNLGSNWATIAHSVGGNWQSGSGIHAFEPNGTALPIGTALTDPDNNNPYVITYYFETEFTLTAQQLANVDEVVINHLIDDGAVFYLNGAEFDRYGIPSGVVNSSTTANRGGESALAGPVTIPPNFLQVGSNRLSIEVHQTSSGSSDVVMGAEVIAREIVTPATPATPFRNSPEQWIEIYNKGNSIVDLSGWEFSDGISFQFPDQTMLGPDEYLVVAGDLASFNTKYPAVVVAGEFNGNLSRRGERIRLRDANKNIADEVRFHDGGRWPEFTDGGGSSLELRDPEANNNNAGAWAASNELSSGSWQSLTYRGQGSNHGNDPTAYHEFIFGLHDAGTVLIDDISVVEDPDGAARELIQNGDFEGGNTDKWRLLGTHRHFEVIPDPDNGGNQVLQVRASGFTEHLSNHAETTFRNNGSYITTNSNQTYEISFRARWMGGSDQLHTRLYFNRLARTHILPHDAFYGTPGALNSIATNNIGPTYTGLTHSPAVPEAGQPCIVSVSPHDPDGISGLSLRYAVNGGSFNSVSMTSQPDGRWSGSIPGQSGSAKVQFYVVATDTLNATSNFPAAGPDSRALIPWQDGQANLDYGSCQPNNLRIVMTTADADLLHLETAYMSNDRIGCTVIYNEKEITYDAGVRLKGSEHGRNKDVRVGWNVRFPSDQPFLGAHRTIAIDRSGAGNQFSQKEILVKHAINHAGGIPGMFDDLIRVIAPRSQHTSSAMLLKSRFDNEWLDNRFSNGGDGRMFEYELVYHMSQTTGGPEGLKLTQDGGVSGVPVRSLGTDKELYRWHWLNKNNRDADDYEGLMAAVTAIGQSSGGQFHADTQQLLDVDQWLRSFAIQNLFGIGDNYSSGSAHNAIVYQRPSDGKVLLFPWDMDFTFSGGSRATGNGDLNKMLSDPGNKHAYYGHLHDIISTTFNTGYMTYWANHYSCFLPTESLTGFLNNINSGASNVTNSINSAVTNVPYQINTGNGQSTSNSFLAVQGEGWVNVREIRATGSTDPLDLVWIDDNTWQVQLPVLPGPNSVTLQAFNLQGEQIGTDTINFTGTGTVVPASANNLVISELMYHPAGPTPSEINAGFTDQDDFEYIELLNISDSIIILTGLDFTNGINFGFGSNTIAPGARALLVGNQAGFQQRYGSGLPVIAQFQLADSNKLSNGGERLTLSDSIGALIRDFTYDDKTPWPTSADGDGHSLVLLCPHDNPDHSLASNWLPSATLGGSPGTEDGVTYASWATTNAVLGLPTDDDDGDFLSNLMEYALGSNPLDPASGAPSGSLVTTSGGDFLALTVTRNLTAAGIEFHAQVSTDLVNWSSDPLEVVLHAALNNGDGTATETYRSTIPRSLRDREFLRIAVEVK